MSKKRTRRAVDVLIAKTLGCPVKEKGISIRHTEPYCECKGRIHSNMRKDSYNNEPLRNIPRYYNDIRDSFRLLKEKHYELGITTVGDLAVGMYYCKIISVDKDHNIIEHKRLGGTQEQAICLAFLEMQDVSNDDIIKAVKEHTFGV